MDRARYRLVKDLFSAACDVEPHARETFLDEACAGDGELRAEVAAMLAAETAAAAQELDRPPAPVLAQDAARQVELPRRIGAFRIVRLIGEGGMGQVFEAEQDDPRRRVAVKILRSGLALPRLLDRFVHEKEVLARLQHPGIALIHEAGTAEIRGALQPYFVMELVHGVAITRHVVEQTLPTRGRLELFIRVCDAVQHAHQNGVIHRDLKPANILVTDSGQPKVLDFGIARAADSGVDLTTVGTDAGRILGTLPYMSPEQARAESDQIDARTDVYALGVLLYELLTERLPYDVKSTSLPEAVRIICEQEPRGISKVRRVLRGDLEKITGKALEKEKERRYPSADALAADVARYLRSEPVTARPASTFYKLGKFTSRNRLFVGALVGLFVSLVAGVILTTRFALLESAQRRASERQSYQARMTAAFAEFDAGRIDQARRQLHAAPPRLRDWEWDYLNGRLDDSQATFFGARAPVLFTASGPAGDPVVAIDASGAAYSWRSAIAEAAVARPALPAVGNTLMTLAIARGGKLAVTEIRSADGAGNEQRVAAVWNTETGKVVQRLRLPGRPRRARPLCSVSPAGKHVAIESHGGYDVFDLASGRRLAGLHGDRTFFSEDGSVLALAGGNKIELRELPSCRVSGSIYPFRGMNVGEAWEGAAQAVAIDTARGLLAAAWKQHVAVWDLEAHRRVASLEPSSFEVRPLRFAADGSLVTVSDEIRTWDPTTGRQLATLAGYVRSWGDPELDPTRRYLIGPHSESSRHGTRTWDTAAPATRVLRGHERYVYPVALGPRGCVIASGSGDHTVRLWEAATGIEIATLWCRATATGLAFDPTRDRLLVAAGALQVFDTATGARREAFREGGKAVAVLPDGSLVLSGGSRSLRTLDADTLTPCAAFDAPAATIAFSRDGALCATTGRSWTSPPPRTIGVWRTRPLTRRFELRAPEPVLSVAVSPGATRLVTGGLEGGVFVWDATRPRAEPVRAARVHRGEVFALEFLSPTRFASGARDGTIRIWDAASCEVVATLRGHTDYVYALDASPDGTRLVSSSGDGTVRIWETTPLAQRLLARRRTERDRQRAERLVERLFASGLAQSQVVARLRGDATLAPPLRRRALHAVLRRATVPLAGAQAEAYARAQPRQRNKVLALDGKSAVALRSLTKLASLDAVTLECWVRGPRPGTRAIVAANTQGSGFGLYWAEPEGELHLPFACVHGMRGYRYAMVKSAPRRNEWTHLAMCHDGHVLRFFVGGQLVSSAAAPGPITPSLFPLLIGADPDPTGPKSFFHGAIDDLRLSRVARYSGPFTPPRVHQRDGDTIVLLHFDAAMRGFHLDASGNGIHGRPIGAPVLVPERRE